MQRVEVMNKRKLAITLASLLLCLAVLISASYAWFSLSRAPEITGIDTHIGSNGSLEIALLSDATYMDPSTIRSMIGDSAVVQDITASNLVWGNVIDLSDESYGLSQISMIPSRLNVTPGTETGNVVTSNMLSIPNYNLDGRLAEFNANTVSATFGDSGFTYTTGIQGYGVRGIGTISHMTAQQSALARSRSLVRSYQSASISATASTWRANGGGLLDIYYRRYYLGSDEFNDSDVAVIRDTAVRMRGALGYIDAALRQGVVGYAASTISDENTFKTVRSSVENTATPLSVLIKAVPGLPGDFSAWITRIETDKAAMQSVVAACDLLTGGSYTWEQIAPILDKVVAGDEVYLGENLLATADAFAAMTDDNVLTLSPDAGVMADVADYSGDYNVFFTYSENVNVEVTSSSIVYTYYLDEVADILENRQAAAGDDTVTDVQLDDVFGYAVDMAFRCNTETELLLQTTPALRVEENTEFVQTQGGGSYMEFSSHDASFTLAQTIQLMDAVRVGFLDDQGNLLGVAKLNTSNRSTTDGVVKAPLYLYDYSFSDADGSMVMGERRKRDNTIAELQQNIAKAITVMVWLDGDQVDNTMVSAEESTSLSGVLNLQFASSADLIPAENTAYMTLTTDITELMGMVAANQATYLAGQGIYTTVSWNAFSVAYNQAASLCNDAAATDSQVWNAASELSQAVRDLEEVSHDALGNMIDDMRDELGETDQVARVVVKDGNNNYTALATYTQEQYDNSIAKINSVDYENNLRDEGNGIYTAIYSDASWNALAAALYSAEAVFADDYATDAQVDAAMTALETSYDALEFAAYFLPYDYNGDLYYQAISTETDTYGKWYDADFQRIVSDKTILDLDAHAEPAEIVEIDQNEDIPWTTSTITPYVDILDNVYSELKEETIAGTKWNTLDTTMFTEYMDQRHVNTLNTLIKQVEDEALTVDTSAAEALLARTDTVTAAEAQSTVDSLSASVSAAKAAKQQEAAANSTDITADQRTMLTVAVNSAKSVAGYDDASKTELDALRSAVTTAEAVLTVAGHSKSQADDALAHLNTQLTANGKKAVTAYNTLTYTVPVDSVSEIVYAVEHPTVTLGLTGKTGTSTLGVVGVTKNGVVFTATKDVTVYTPADGAELQTTAGVNAGESVEIKVGEALDLQALLYYSDTRSQKEIDLGNVTVTDGSLASISVSESVVKYTWGSQDLRIVALSGANAQTCSLQAMAEGTVQITVSITTEEGNSYTDTITVTVTPG